jgi:phage terminase small subunit
VSDLSEQQERFCQFVIQGFTQTEAYKRAGYKSKDDHAAAANASRLIANDRVAQRIAELRAPVAERAEVTLEYLQKRARRLLNKAEKAGQFSAANGALKELGILSGKRIETRHNLNQDANEPTDLTRAQLLDIARAGRTRASASGDGAGKPDSVHPVH